MSYYYKDKNGVVHTDEENSFETAFRLYNSTVPFNNNLNNCASWTQGMYHSIFSGTDYCGNPYQDYDGDSPTYFYKFNDQQILPFIGIKDGSTKVYESLYCLTTGGFKPFVGHFSTTDYGYPLWILNGLYISNYKQYYIDLYELESNPNANNPSVYFQQRHSYGKFFEVYKDRTPVINYVDRDKGNLLNFCYSGIQPDGYGEFGLLKSNCYWNGKWGPYYYEGEGADEDKFIRANQSHITSTGSIYNFNTNLSLSNGSEPSYMNVYKKINFSAIRNFNDDKFGMVDRNAFLYFPEGAPEPVQITTNYFKYYTLNVNDIKQNYKKLKLKYFYSILFDGKYTQISGTEATAPNQYSSSITGHKIDKSEIEKSKIDDKTKGAIFSFNYCLSTASLWPINELTENSEPVFTLHENLETSLITNKDGENENVVGSNAIEDYKMYEIGYRNPNNIVDSFDPSQGEKHVFDNLYITKMNDLAGEGSLSSIGEINGVRILIKPGSYVKGSWNSTTYYSQGDLVVAVNGYICKEPNIGKDPNSNPDYWFKTPAYPHLVSSGEVLGKYNIPPVTGLVPAQITNLKSYIIEHNYNNPFIIFYGTDNDNCFIERTESNPNKPDIYGNFYNATNCFQGVDCYSGYFNSVPYNDHLDDFDPNKKYKKGDEFKTPFACYKTNVNIVKDGTREVNTTLNIKGGAYNIYNASGLEHLRNYKSTNLIGSAEYTIDLTNVEEDYIHIAYPATILFNQELFPEEKCHVYVTDLKMTYEGVE